MRKKTARSNPEKQRKTQRNRSKLGRPGSVMYLAGEKSDNAKILSLRSHFSPCRDVPSK